MNVKFIINIVQIVLAIFLIIAIILQARGSGLGSAFGGDNMVFRTKRGVEKILHTITIVLAIIFLGLSLGLIFIK
ncbi:MAG: preprotein translocase subunit SecG [Parcubacteria group bacterium CG10_big_fil_rev_8_21_14_0_10_36_14]|nr:MAG: preprotein translocase subunit SecG [Parcubacteria group bacterium CG10_big_fil_rev_8_21_14_0_10_36_14]